MVIAYIRKSAIGILQLPETHEGVVDCGVPFSKEDHEIVAEEWRAEGSQGRIRQSRRWGDGVVSH